MRGESKIIQHGYRQFKVIKTGDIAKDHKTSIYELEKPLPKEKMKK